MNYQQLFRGMLGHYLVLNLDFDIVEVTDSYLQVTHTTREQLLKKNLFDVFFSDHSEETGAILRSSLALVARTHAKHEIGVVNYLLLGELTYWRVENFPILDDAGQTEFIIHSIVNVTSEVKMKLSLDEKIKDNELLRVITDHIPSLVGYMDQNGTYLFANKTYERAFGLSQEQIIGKKRQEFVSADVAERAAKSHERVLEGHVVEYENTIRIDGKNVQLQIAYVPDKHPLTGQVRGAVLVGHDVTELKKAIELRDEFLSVASHELRTPLTSLQLQMHMMKRLLERGDLEKLDPTKLTALIGGTARSIQRITRLIDDMLDISRMDSGS